MKGGVREEAGVKPIFFRQFEAKVEGEGGAL